MMVTHQAGVVMVLALLFLASFMFSGCAGNKKSRTKKKASAVEAAASTYDKSHKDMEYDVDPAIEERVAKFRGLNNEYRAKFLRYCLSFNPEARHEIFDLMERKTRKGQMKFIDGLLKVCAEKRRNSMHNLITRFEADWSGDSRFGGLPRALSNAQRNHILGALSMVRKKTSDAVLKRLHSLAERHNVNGDQIIKVFKNAIESFVNVYESRAAIPKLFQKNGGPYAKDGDKMITKTKELEDTLQRTLIDGLLNLITDSLDSEGCGEHEHSESSIPRYGVVVLTCRNGVYRIDEHNNLGLLIIIIICVYL